MLKYLVTELIEIFFPKLCVYCGAYENSFFCIECRKALIQYEPESFISRKKSKHWELMVDEKNHTYLEKVFYFYNYSDSLHSLIKSIKYDFHLNKVETLVELFFESNEFQKIDLNKFDIFTFIPLSKERQNWRGFNHTQLITKSIAQKLNKPFCQILIKKKETKSQIDLSKVEREKNLHEAFCIKEILPIQLKDQYILLIDDVCTTGSTLNECAKTIKTQFPNTKIYGLCLARGN